MIDAKERYEQTYKRLKHYTDLKCDNTFHPTTTTAFIVAEQPEIELCVDDDGMHYIIARRFDIVQDEILLEHIYAIEMQNKYGISECKDVVSVVNFEDKKFESESIFDCEKHIEILFGYPITEWIFNNDGRIRKYAKYMKSCNKNE